MTTWHSNHWEPKGDTQWSGAMGGFVWPRNYLPKESDTMEYGSLFAYMFRRFGPPRYGSDCLKVIACWYITTPPDENVALTVSPNPSGTTFSFGYIINESVYNDCRDEAQVKAVEIALVQAILDLLTPVYVRDIPINAAGRVANDSPLLELVCDRFEWAGYGVGHDYFRSIAQDNPDRPRGESGAEFAIEDLPFADDIVEAIEAI